MGTPASLERRRGVELIGALMRCALQGSYFSRVSWM
jgi:hypothetical protein